MFVESVVCLGYPAIQSAPDEEQSHTVLAALLLAKKSHPVSVMELSDCSF